jgi:hypothetical protein
VPGRPIAGLCRAKDGGVSAAGEPDETPRRQLDPAGDDGQLAERLQDVEGQLVQPGQEGVGLGEAQPRRASRSTAGRRSGMGGSYIPRTATNLASRATGVWKAAQGLLVITVLASLLAWIAVQVPAFRRSAGERRQQLKWLYSGAIVFVITIFLSVLTPNGSSGFAGAVNDIVGPFGFAVLPVCVGVAVLKYRLYDIDRHRRVAGRAKRVDDASSMKELAQRPIDPVTTAANFLPNERGY